MIRISDILTDNKLPNDRGIQSWRENGFVLKSNKLAVKSFKVIRIVQILKGLL